MVWTSFVKWALKVSPSTVKSKSVVWGVTMISLRHQPPIRSFQALRPGSLPTPDHSPSHWTWHPTVPKRENRISQNYEKPSHSIDTGFQHPHKHVNTGFKSNTSNIESMPTKVEINRFCACIQQNQRWFISTLARKMLVQNSANSFRIRRPRLPT